MALKKLAKKVGYVLLRSILCLIQAYKKFIDCKFKKKNNLSKVVNDNNSLSFSTFQPAQATIEQNQQQLQNTSVQAAKNVADSMLCNSKPRSWIKGRSNRKEKMKKLHLTKNKFSISNLSSKFLRNSVFTN